MVEVGANSKPRIKFIKHEAQMIVFYFMIVV